jgi:hypothetical protein
MVVILGCTTLLGLVNGTIDLIQWLHARRSPALAVVFVGDADSQAELMVTPTWPNPGALGFSAPLPYSIGILNTGKAPATDVRLLLLYPAGILAIDSPSARHVRAGVLPASADPHRGTRVLEYAIPSIPPSPIPTVCENALELRVRLRMTLGQPTVHDKLLRLNRLYVSIKDSAVDSLGQFSLPYLISCAEVTEPRVGQLRMRVPTGVVTASSSALDTDVFLGGRDLEPRKSYPIGVQPTSRRQKTVTLVSLDDSTSLRTCDVIQSRSDSLSWTEVVAGMDHFLEVDSNLDDLVDTVYYGVCGRDPAWWRMAPQPEFPVVEFDNIVGLDQESWKAMAARNFDNTQ